MSEKRAKKSMKKVEKRYESDDEADDADDMLPMMQQQQQHQEKAMKLIPAPPPFPSKGAPIMRQKQAKFASEPARIPNRIRSPPDSTDLFQQLQVMQNTMEANINQMSYAEKTLPIPFSPPPLPPITTTENLNDILQSKIESPTIKSFKVIHHYFNEI